MSISNRRFLGPFDAFDDELAFNVLKLLAFPLAQKSSHKPSLHFLGCVNDSLLRFFKYDF